jgi:hypothetical protein
MYNLVTWFRKWWRKETGAEHKVHIFPEVYKKSVKGTDVSMTKIHVMDRCRDHGPRDACILDLSTTYR